MAAAHGGKPLVKSRAKAGRSRSHRRRILFVTGSRAELGLMLRTLDAIRGHPRLELLVAATGMHLDPASGPRLAALKSAGITADAVAPWPPARNPLQLADITGRAVASLAAAYRRLKPDVVLVVGDRVEAFAAASAAHIARIPLAHVHGGDRAEGQVDDALRHAITQLAHLHLAASADAVRRIRRLGQDPQTIHLVGAPGVEAIGAEAASASEVRKLFPDISASPLVLLHPTSPDPQVEKRRAAQVVLALMRLRERRPVLGYPILLMPNNDPGAGGIRDVWAALEGLLPRCGDLPRPLFLGLMRDCRMLVGNSSAGIIEAGSFGTPVLNIGPRQAGRLRGPNVMDASYSPAAILAAATRILARSRPRSSTRASDNPYSRPATARRIATLLADPTLSPPAESKRLGF